MDLRFLIIMPIAETPTNATTTITRIIEALLSFLMKNRLLELEMPPNPSYGLLSWFANAHASYRALKVENS